MVRAPLDRLTVHGPATSKLESFHTPDWQSSLTTRVKLPLQEDFLRRQYIHKNYNALKLQHLKRRTLCCFRNKHIQILRKRWTDI